MVQRHTIAAAIMAVIMALVLFALPAHAQTVTYLPTVIRVDAAPSGAPWTYEQWGRSWFTYSEFFSAKRAMFGSSRVAWRCYLAGDGNYNHLSVCYVLRGEESYAYTADGWQ